MHSKGNDTPASQAPSGTSGEGSNLIQILIATRFLAEQSDPASQRFAFAYTITIRNQSPHTCQLISRRWVITDDNNDVQEVSGLGVVGEQPILAAGEEYTYTSGSLLKTETGTMEGAYSMVYTDSGETFEAPIPSFALVPPYLLH